MSSRAVRPPRNSTNSKNGNLQSIQKKPKTRKRLTIAEKQDIITKRAAGVRPSVLAKEHSVNSSSILTIWANREAIMKCSPAQGLMRVCTERRPPVVSEIETQLLEWLNEKENPKEVSTQEIREKAREILRSLQQTNPQETQFQASRSWCESFKTRVGICPKVKQQSSKTKQEKTDDIKLENETDEMDYDPLALGEEDETAEEPQLPSVSTSASAAIHVGKIKPPPRIGEAQFLGEIYRNQMELGKKLQNFTQIFIEKMDAFQKSLDRLVELKKEELELQTASFDLRKMEFLDRPL